MRARRLIGAVALAATAIMLGGSPSSAMAPPKTAVAVAHLTFLPGDWKLPSPLNEVHVAAGGTIQFLNADPDAPHTFSSYPDAEEHYLFTSKTLQPGSTGDVGGVSALAPGRYPFTCQIHMDLMRGVLVVEEG